jgi:hypothetical protein
VRLALAGESGTALKGVLAGEPGTALRVVSDVERRPW